LAREREREAERKMKHQIFIKISSVMLFWEGTLGVSNQQRDKHGIMQISIYIYCNADETLNSGTPLIRIRQLKRLLLVSRDGK
jgi:hypothetical protein